MKAYLDGKQVASSAKGSLSASVPAAVGKHTLIVQAWNSAGTVYKASETFTIH